MKIDFDNGLPVWVWGLLFVLLVLPFSFRPVQEKEPKTELLPGAATPTAVIEPVVAPLATEPIEIEIAPAPNPAEE